MFGSRSRWFMVCFAMALTVQAQEAPAAVQDPSQDTLTLRVQSDSNQWIGILMTDAVDGGTRLAGVIPDGPADRAGLRAGDVLIRIDEQPVAGGQSVRELLTQHDETLPLQVIYLREGRTREAAIYPERRRLPGIPIDVVTSFIERPSSQLKITSMTPELRGHYGAPPDRGVLVLKVEADSLAAKAGFAVGDILLDACDKPLDSEQVWQRCVQQSSRQGEIEVVRLRKGRKETIKWENPRPARFRFGPLTETLISAEPMRIRRREMLEIEIQRLKSLLRELESDLERLNSTEEAEPDR